LRGSPELRDTPAPVTLIDRSNHHLFQPLLYQVTTGALSPANIAAPLRGTLRRQSPPPQHHRRHRRFRYVSGAPRAVGVLLAILERLDCPPGEFFDAIPGFAAFSTPGWRRR